MSRAFSMHEYQRVVATEGRVSGSWHVNLGTRDVSDVWIKAHDVTIYDDTRREGRVYFSDDLTCRIRAGVAEITYVNRDKQYEVAEVRADILRLLPAIAQAAKYEAVVEVPEPTDQDQADGGA